MSQDRIFTRSRELGDELSQFLAELVSLPSPSGQEAAVVERIAVEMRRAGFDEVRTDGLGSIVGRIGSGPVVIAIDGHIDTVGVGNRDLWSFEPHHGHVRDGRVWGRGTADQKGGVAAAVYGGRILKELGLVDGRFTLLVTGTVMEEDCDGLCWRYLVEQEGVRPEVCVITEPTSLRVYRGQRGRMEIRVTVDGLSAHGSAPERGVNAVYKMARVVGALEALNERLPSDDFLGKGTLVVSEITSVSPSQCAVPDQCSIHIDRRLTFGETEESALGEIRAAMASVGVEGRVEVPEYQGRGWTGRVFPMKKYYPVWKTPAEHAAVTAAVADHRARFGSDPTVGRWTFSTNGVAIAGMHGIPCVGFGPGNEEQAHAPDEWTPVEDLVRAAAFYAGFPAEYLSRR
jgi:putative selenium metabolism hydrolase